MANPEHLAILNQGVKVWNKWREQEPGIRPDLSGADLRSSRDLRWVNFSHAKLHDAKLCGVNLQVARLEGADLPGAKLCKANLGSADLRVANLTSANLCGVDLQGANLAWANLTDADLEGAKLYLTIFGDTNLSHARGLETCVHLGRSSIDFHTLQISGLLPPAFLRGCRLPKDLIENLSKLLEKKYSSCFISHSNKDEKFAKKLYDDLWDKGVPCWKYSEDVKIGELPPEMIDKAIKEHDKLLLILSRNSIKSVRVKEEVELARKEEKRRDKKVVFPIRLDTALEKSPPQWVHDIWEDRKNSRHVGDFRKWQVPSEYNESFERLLHDLRVPSQQTTQNAEAG
ncbi:MAG: toll/interleukin-1 receptor domain-containing protein [Candidatus Tectomicrobia bacterium]|nr:toll/interleukin-1 receptor domain-containing protein [Candidatus Tectomicrobia bacterium]